MSTRLYLDHNATAPLCASAREAMLQAMTVLGNPSSKHADGDAARGLLGRSRKAIAMALGASPAQVVLTSGASESNATAIASAMRVRSSEGRRAIVVSAIEHPSIHAAAASWLSAGGEVRIAPVTAAGVVDLDALAAVLDEQVALVCIMAANNETGVLQPVAEVAARARACGAWTHVDITQAFGRIPIDLANWGADSASASGHKLGSPAGVGVLWLRQSLPFVPWLPGHQERHRRGGTENLIGIAAMAAAAASALAGSPHVGDVRDAFERALLTALPWAVVNGAQAPRLNNTSNLCLFAPSGPLDADLLLIKLDQAGISASSGAACAAGGADPSHVLLAMGLSAAHARASLRFSFGREHTVAEAEWAAEVLAHIVQPLVQRVA